MDNPTVKIISSGLKEEYKKWQKCPVCNGSGQSKGWTINYLSNCEVCKGKRIINIETGKPPKN